MRWRHLSTYLITAASVICETDTLRTQSWGNTCGVLGRAWKWPGQNQSCGLLVVSACRLQQPPPRASGRSQATEQAAHGETPPWGAQARLDRVPSSRPRPGDEPDGSALWCRAPAARGRQRLGRGAPGWARPRPEAPAGLPAPPPRGCPAPRPGPLRSSSAPGLPPGRSAVLVPLRRSGKVRSACWLGRELHARGRRAEQPFPMGSTVSTALYE